MDMPLRPVHELLQGEPKVNHHTVHVTANARPERFPLAATLRIIHYYLGANPKFAA